MSKTLLLCLSLVAVLSLLSCPPAVPPDEEPQSYAITGTIHDALNGALIPGATFRYGDASGTTGSDGAFSVDLGTTAGVFDRALGMSAAGYTPRYIDPVRVDTGNDNTFTLVLRPLSTVTYTLKNLHVTVFQSDGTTEIQDATVGLGILPMNGVFAPIGSAAYDVGNGYYQFTTRVYSADCLLLAMVTMSDPAQSFVVHRTGVNLSGPGPIDVSFTMPTTDTRNIQLTAQNADCAATGSFQTPYGLVLMLCRYQTSSVWQLDTKVLFTDTLMKTVTVYNPDNWPCYWAQSMHDTGYGGTGYKLLMSTTAFAPLPASLTLPSLSTSTGPSDDPVVGSWLYDSASGAITIDVIPDTFVYQYAIIDSGGINRGIVVGFTSSLTLPSWLNTTISDKSPLQFMFTPMGTDLTAYTMEMVELDAYPPGARFGLLQETAGNGYVKTFTF